MNNDTEQLSAELAVTLGPESGKVTLSETGLAFADDCSIEQWREVVKVIKMAKTKLNLWLGDAYSFATTKWGQETADAELGQFELNLSDVRAAIAINTVPRELRYANLSSEHYIELSKAPDKKKQIKWARIASEQNLTPTQLRFSIIENEVVDMAAAKQLKSGVVTIQGIRQSFDVWLRKVGGIDGVQGMEKDHQEEILNELDEIIDFGMQLRGELGILETV